MCEIVCVVLLFSSLFLFLPFLTFQPVSFTTSACKSALAAPSSIKVSGIRTLALAHTHFPTIAHTNKHVHIQSYSLTSTHLY